MSPETQSLRILHLEDNESDGELVALALAKLERRPAITRVDNGPAFEAALNGGGFDLILCDFSIPGFGGRAALAAARAHALDTPFIFVSGTIGEDRAVEALREGATDYILKDRISRLPAAVRGALEAQERQRALRAAEERIREQAALLEQAREAIVVQDLQHNITYWSRGAERLYGWSPEEAVRGDANARVPESARAEEDAAWTAVLAVGQWDGTLKRARRDGREIVLESHWTSLLGPDGSLRAVLSISSDITASHNLETQLLRSQRLETVGMVASGIAHDLNNVLAPILMGVSGLRRTVSDERGLRLLKAMEVSADRGSDIVRQVLTFARGTNGTVGAIDAKDSIAGIEGLLKATLPPGVTLRFQVADALAPIRCDPTQLHQVLLNLCINARDAMPQGGTLAITAEAGSGLPPNAGEYVRIRVADTGQGMPPEILQRIFEPFYTTKARGTGIGLSTVRTIVERHGGFVEVDSTPGQGTEFRLYFPAAHTPASAPDGLVPTPASAAAEERVLLIVDEGLLREIMRETLTAYGYRVICAMDSADAVAQYAEYRDRNPVLLVNFSMSSVDAVALVRLIAAENPRAKIIETSGSEIAVRDGSLSGVVRATLAPPYSPATLIEVVGQVVDAP